ncbi:hypothetical protein J6590_023370 [Homalodisca vitripennis]|nr:hypothetical protein J6590_023370 [Homalodisca vitripennis]
MLAASVDYRHGLADCWVGADVGSLSRLPAWQMCRCLSSVVYSLCPVLQCWSERMLAVSDPAWPGRCKAVWLSVQWFTHCGPVLQCWVASGCWQPQ